MSAFNKVLASVGIGAATVDTKLESEQVVPGEEVQGIVEIQGGNVNNKLMKFIFLLTLNMLKNPMIISTMSR